jgi:hypothetical protein
MAVSPSTIVTPVDDVAFREIDREAVILNLATGRYFGLNGVATRAWLLLAQGLSVGEAVRRLGEEYVIGWVETLLDRGLVTER